MNSKIQTVEQTEQLAQEVKKIFEIVVPCSGYELVSITQENGRTFVRVESDHGINARDIEQLKPTLTFLFVAGGIRKRFMIEFVVGDLI